VVAKIVAVLVVELVQLAVLVIVALFGFGWAPGAGWSVVVVAAALLLGTAAFAGLGLWMAGSLRAEATLAGANGLYLGLLLLGGIIVPVDRLPPFLADLAGVLPAAALADAFRIGLGAAGDPVGSLLVVAAWAVGATALAALTFHWD